MSNWNRASISILKVADLILGVLSFLAVTAFLVRTQSSMSLRQFLSLRFTVWNFFIGALIVAVCHVVLSSCGVYRSRRLSGMRGEALDIIQAITVIVTCLVIISSALDIRMMSLSFLAYFGVAGSLSLWLERILLRSVMARFRASGKNLRYMLIIGTNERAIEFARKVTASRERGYRLLGFVDNEWAGLEKFKQSGFRLVSGYAGLAEYLRRNVVDEVTIYLPVGSFYSYAHEVAELCREQGITMRYNSDIFGLRTTKWRSEEFDGSHYIAACSNDNGWGPEAAKRMLDVAVSGSLLLAISPILIAAAIAIKLTSPGPVFFLQERLGVNKRRFKIFKFRTMVPNAEKMIKELESLNEMSGPTFKIKDDPRITQIGKLMRKTSIDELPQLLNVLLGDMSLVGPRPLPVRDYEGFDKDWQRRRFSVKPGITCLWQVSGRSNISFEKWMLLDLQYMDEWSLWLDLKILARTVPVVLRGEGAA
jgi:exopolysaccharide biosynthesis polyprenyl glycosylphosphotransferase